MSTRNEINPVDLTHLRRAIALAAEASAYGDNPYGAVLVDSRSQVLLAARNTEYSERDCTGHAETNLLREASRRFDRKVLATCTIYANGEPCAMCAGAIYWSGVRRLVFALPFEVMTAIAGEKADELSLSCRHILAHGMRTVEVLGPGLELEARAVLEAHYKRR